MTPEQTARFWGKVDQSGECWLWTGPLSTNGYGLFSVNGKMRGAHRVAWELEHGPIPPDKEVCHDCPGGDNRACVRHLWLGTHKENMWDAQSKGRTSGRARGWQGKPKVTMEIAQEIKARHATGLSCAAIARQFNLTPATVSNIVRGKTWAEDPKVSRARAQQATIARRRQEERLRELLRGAIARFPVVSGAEYWMIAEIPVEVA